MAEGATGLISFGLAGGLDPSMPPGAVLVPEAVLVDGTRRPTDPALSHWLGGTTPHCLFGAGAVVADAAEKRRVWQATGAAAVDLESGAVARSGLPFTALRVVCDPAQRSLPSAVLAALNPRGAIRLWSVLAALAAHPGQLAALLHLASDAARARRALDDRVSRIAPWREPGAARR